MALRLAQEEPEAGPWRAERLTEVVESLLRRGAAGRPVILAIDGRSNNGKTTLAGRIGGVVAGSVVVHTDDIAWQHSRFGWSDLLIDGILVPARHGRAVSFRPPAWARHGREGSVEVPSGCPLLIIEGDGAGRREVAHLIDVLIWGQSDLGEVGRRAVARIDHPDDIDAANQPADGAAPDEAGWMAEEIPFNTAQRTWERADLVVCGTPQIPWDPVADIVVAPPRLAAAR